MNHPLRKHGSHCPWRCLTVLPLDILITSASSHHGSMLSILLNRLICLFRNVWFPLVGAVYVGVKPIHMIFGGVGIPPALHRGVEPTCCLSYGLFSHTHMHGHGIPVCILGASQGGERWMFPVYPRGYNLWYQNLFTWCHESHWCLLSWIFIICFCRS